MKNGLNRYAIYILILWALMSSAPTAAELEPIYDGPDTPEYLVPVNGFTVPLARLHSNEGLLCVIDQCYMVTDKATAEWYVDTKLAGRYAPVLQYELFDIYAEAIAAVPGASNINTWGADKGRWDAAKALMPNPPVSNMPVVAVIDTGLAPHEAFAAGVVGGYTYSNGRFVAASENDTYDVHMHGTHVAGIIAGSGKLKGTGLEQARVLAFPAAVYSNGNATLPLTRVLAAIDKIYQLKKSGMPIVAVNMSYGQGYYSQDEYRAIQKLQEAGIIVVAAAGNDGASLWRTSTYPANYNLPNIVTVAALENRAGLSVWYKSNYSGPTSIAAPGEKIYSTAVYYIPETIGGDKITNVDSRYSISSSDRHGAIILPPGKTLSVSYDIHGRTIRYSPFTLSETRAISVPFQYSSANVEVLSGDMSGAKVYYSGSDKANWYVEASGTSMAAPYVSGAIAAANALYYSKKGSLLPSEQAIAMLYSSAERSASLEGKVQGNRGIDLRAYLEAVGKCADNEALCPQKAYPVRIDMPVVKGPSSGGGGGGCAMTADAEFNLSSLLLAAALLFIYKRYRAIYGEKNGKER